MLSAYRPGTTATPFENYCTSALSYFLTTGHPALTALFQARAGNPGARINEASIQRQLGASGYADLTIEFDDSRIAVVEVMVEPLIEPDELASLAEASQQWAGDPALLVVCLDPDSAPAPWVALSWAEIASALLDGGDPLATQFAEFIQRDILGFGSVPLDQAITTNRLYALGAATIRRRFGDQARYVNSASRPVSGRYRYLGTTFSVDGTDMTYWIGIVNEAVPLSDHYYLMLASKEWPVAQPSDHPRATADWKWAHWTTHGRVVRPVTADVYDALLRRIDPQE